MLVILKAICLTVAIAFTASNAVNAARGHVVFASNVWLMSASIVGFIWLHWWM